MVTIFWTPKCLRVVSVSGPTHSQQAACLWLKELSRCLIVLCLSGFSYQSSGAKAVPVAFQTTGWFISQSNGSGPQNRGCSCLTSNTTSQQPGRVKVGFLWHLQKGIWSRFCDLSVDETVKVWRKQILCAQPQKGREWNGILLTFHLQRAAQ